MKRGLKGVTQTLDVVVMRLAALLSGSAGQIKKQDIKGGPPRSNSGTNQIAALGVRVGLGASGQRFRDL